MLVTDKPENLPTTNALDGIPADLLGPVPRELRLGANVLMVLEDPPKLGETRDVVVRLRVTREGAEQKAVEGETTHFCGGKIVTAWLLGQPVPPKADEDQGALIDEDGEISDEAAGTEPDADGGWDDEPDNVARPNFSDGGK
ncbi:hypothetical protein ACORG1_13290 [Mycobacterium sp. TJFP1]